MAKYSRDQWLVVAAAVVFLIGGVFMLINVFGGEEWAMWVGLGLAFLACALMVWGGLDARKRVQGNMQATVPTNANDLETAEGKENSEEV